MRRKFLLPLALLLLLTGCAAGGAAPETSRYAPEDAQRLVVYTSHKEEIYWPIIQEFEQRTGIWVEVVTGGTNELLERIEREKNAPAADVMFGGGVESLGSYQDCFTPYTSSQARYIQERFRDEEGLWTPFSALPVVLIYNTKLVEPEQITGWSDLLSPDFQGRIAFADPGVSGSCFTGLVTLIYAVEGEDALQRFAENLDGRQLDDSGDVLTSVAGGTDLVGSRWKAPPCSVWLLVTILPWSTPLTAPAASPTPAPCLKERPMRTTPGCFWTSPSAGMRRNCWPPGFTAARCAAM